MGGAGRWLLVVLALVGCAERRAETPPGEVRLVFRHSRMPGDADPLPALLREFERRHPGIAVREQTLPASSDNPTRSA